jgi:hypothetical protein
MIFPSRFFAAFFTTATHFKAHFLETNLFGDAKNPSLSPYNVSTVKTRGSERNRSPASNNFSIIPCNRIQFWGVASASNIEILERFQSKALRMVVDAPWYVPNTVIRRDLQTPTIEEEIRRYSSQYSARLSAHPNGLVMNLMELPDNRLLRKHPPNDLPTRFLV